MNTFWFAGFQLPIEAGLTHIAYIGSTGSGKSVSQRMLYQDTLPQVIGATGNYHHGQRCLIFDAKGDTHSVLLGMNIDRKYIRTLNPFDARCFVPDFDIKDEATCLEISAILVPERDENTPFFRQAVRDLLSGVMASYVYRVPDEWTFRDVIIPLLHKDYSLLKKVLRACPYTEDRLQYFLNAETASNIMSSARTLIKPYQIIAALWHNITKHPTNEYRKISLEKDWVKNPSAEILLLGNSHKLKESLKAVNQVIFKRLSQLLLDEPEVEQGETRKTWIHLDEAKELGKLDGLQDLLTAGRSKGCCFSLGIQSVEGFREIWGEKIANEILGQCASKAFFRLSDSATAQFASDHFGYVEEWQKSESDSHSVSETDDFPSRKTTTDAHTTNMQWIKRDVVTPNELLSLPITNDKNGIHGFYISPYFKEIGLPSSFYSEPIPTNKIFNGQLKDRADKRSDFFPRPLEDQILEAWTEEDFQRLKLSKDEGNDDDLPPVVRITKL